MGSRHDVNGTLPRGQPHTEDHSADHKAGQVESRDAGRAKGITSATSRAAFDQLCAAFAAARLARPDEYVEACYTLAGQPVQIRCVGRALAAIYRRAFAPRARTLLPDAVLGHARPALTIDLWDEEVTGVRYPWLGVAWDELPRSEEFYTQQNDESGCWVWLRAREGATWLDRKAQHMIGWRTSAGQVPLHERSKPFHVLLPLWFYDRDIHVLHAGMVARPQPDGGRAGVLIAGGSGIGKTTTSLCCLLNGLDFLSDDQVAVARIDSDTRTDCDIHTGSNAETFTAHAVYQSARLLPDHLQRFPALKAAAIPGQPPLDPKALIFLAEQFPDRVAACAHICAIALPRLSGKAQSHFRRAARVEAMNYMAHTSLVTPFGLGRTRFVHMLALLSSAPCYWLELGHDLAQIPAVVDQLIEEAT